MNKREAIIASISALYDEGLLLGAAFEKNEETSFNFGYQNWYTKALKVVDSLAPDRYEEFRSYYEINPKRKSLGYGTYVIQDYLKMIIPNGNFDFNRRGVVINCFSNQLAILNSITNRCDSILGNIEGELYAELQDNEIATAKLLIKISPRAAGALVGVIIETHLQKVANSHGIKIGKKSPTIADLNEPLKTALVIDTPTWRKISYLADLRNLCSHKKDVDPTKEQVEELIKGADWLTKNVF
ncbi:hypothetical protein [Methylomonas koyamae]|uniref:hypothetical protein n=1 Tax=Methylomonas koyamae TaxID=702114 RepID=UPI00112E10B5|nr:hypothetical protein [Methylomonas koyamae]TPQ24953.1 hypothetical protein C2U68_17405 [Methylomonas koyamae]